MRHNWRTGKRVYRITTVPESGRLAAYSFFDEGLPIAYVSEQPQCMYPRLVGCVCNDILMQHRPLPIYHGDVQQPSKFVALRVSILASAYPRTFD